MREFLAKHDAKPGWRFLTGTLQQSEALQRAFDIYRGNRNAHPPAYFIRDAKSGNWWRIGGLSRRRGRGRRVPAAGRDEQVAGPLPMSLAKARAAALVALVAAGTVSGGGAPPPVGSSPAADADAEAGRRLYMEGVLSTGAPVTGTVRGGEPLAGPQAACVTCHRRSGLGLVEGGMTSLPVTGDILYRPVWRGRPEMEMARTTGPNARPAYTDESLAQALVSGAGANGIALAPTMPRYALPDADTRNLIAYLKTLSSKASPGADASTVRFATIVAGDVAPERRKALVDVMETFVREKNGGTRYENRRRTRPPMDMEFEYIRYRDWIFDVWTVTGPPASWPAQLEALYLKQPVFAVLSGVAEGDWAPVHEFCESTRLPCVFPTTNLPVIDATDFYTVYFTPRHGARGRGAGAVREEPAR